MTENVKSKTYEVKRLRSLDTLYWIQGTKSKVSQAEAERLSLNDSIEIIGKKKTSSFEESDQNQTNYFILFYF